MPSQGSHIRCPAPLQMTCHVAFLQRGVRQLKRQAATKQCRQLQLKHWNAFCLDHLFSCAAIHDWQGCPLFWLVTWLVQDTRVAAVPYIVHHTCGASKAMQTAAASDKDEGAAQGYTFRTCIWQACTHGVLSSSRCSQRYDLTACRDLCS